MDERLTFDELAALEPRLGVLYRQAKGQGGQPRPADFCANETWYTLFKPRLLRLVGWEAPQRADPRLRTAAAYDVAYEAVYDALPGCGPRCGCL